MEGPFLESSSKPVRNLPRRQAGTVVCPQRTKVWLQGSPLDSPLRSQGQGQDTHSILDPE